MDDKVQDPVCGMMIRPEDAVASEMHGERRFYFCSKECHDTFVDDPHRYGHPDQAGHQGGHGHHG